MFIDDVKLHERTLWKVFYASSDSERNIDVWQETSDEMNGWRCLRIFPIGFLIRLCGNERLLLLFERFLLVPKLFIFYFCKVKRWMLAQSLVLFSRI